MSFIPFQQNEIRGAIAVNTFAILSTLALVSVAVRVIWLAVHRLLERNHAEPSPREYVFFHTQLGHYAACLLIANLCIGTAGLMGIPWLVHKGITEGLVCTAQATVMQIGNFSTAYFTVTIAVHTFNSLVLRKRQSALICVTVIAFGWISSGVLAALPLLRSQPLGPLYGGSGLSCGVRRVYAKPQFFFHLLPIFIASILSAVLYSIIFLVLRGTLVIKGGLKLTLDPNERWGGHGGINYHHFIASIARSMLWYPIAYVTLLVPYSVTRLLNLSGFAVPFPASVFAYTCWFTLGIVNVLLLYNTFRVLGPAFDARPTLTQKAMESFSTPEAFRRSTPLNLYGPRSPMEEKIKQYRSPIIVSPSRSGVPGTTSAATSVRALIPDSTGRAASTQSFYSYSSSPSIDRAITPVSDLNRDIVVTPEPGLPKFSSGALLPITDRLQQVASDSFSLPAPPRPTRSAVSRHPTLESISSEAKGGDTWANVDLESFGRMTPVSRSSVQSTASRNQKGVAHERSSSVSSAELNISDWLARQPSNESIPHRIKNQPSLSAVNSSFPSQATAYSSRRVSIMPDQDSNFTDGYVAEIMISPPQVLQSGGRRTAPRRQRNGGGSLGGSSVSQVPPNLPRSNT